MSILPFEEGEEVLLRVRRHWFVLFGSIFSVVVAVLLPLVAFVFVKRNLPDLLFSIEGGKYLLVFLYSIWLIFWWTFLFMRWTDYYLDVWYVTNKRIVDIEQRGVFYREVTTLRLEKVQDITVEIPGIVATLLNFGDIHVQTAGENRSIIIGHAKDPERVKRQISLEMDRVIDYSLKTEAQKTKQSETDPQQT